MTFPTSLRLCIAAAVLATVPLSAAAAPAHAEPTPARVSNHLAPDDQPHDPLVYLQDTSIWKGAPVALVPAGRPVQLAIWFVLDVDWLDYTDLRYETSHPGTESCRPMTSIGADTDYQGMFMSCPVTLPAMKPGTTQTYTVTFSGKRAGKPFSVTSSTQIYAADLRVGIFIDGKRITGTWYEIPRSKKTFTVTYVLENRSPDTVDSATTGVRSECSTGPIPPGKSGTCSYTLKRNDVIYRTRSYGAFQMDDLNVSIGTLSGPAGTAPRTFITAS